MHKKRPFRALSADRAIKPIAHRNELIFMDFMFCLFRMQSSQSLAWQGPACKRTDLSTKLSTVSGEDYERQKIKDLFPDVDVNSRCNHLLT
jgi:hypothetical protein